MIHDIDTQIMIQWILDENDFTYHRNPAVDFHISYNVIHSFMIDFILNCLSFFFLNENERIFEMM